MNYLLLLLSTSIMLQLYHTESRKNEEKHTLKHFCGEPMTTHLLEYAKFHANVLAGKEPPRYIISIPVEAGMADRLMGIISQFWLAFFSKRAFQISSVYDKVPRFEYAYDHHYIDWSRANGSDAPKLYENLVYTYKGQRGYEGNRSYEDPSIDQSIYFPDYMINMNKRVLEVFGQSNLTEYPSKAAMYPHAHTVYTSSNRGGIRLLAENTIMKETLAELGFNKYTAFRCAYRFLFKENAEVEKISEPYRKAMFPATNGVPEVTHGNNNMNKVLQICIGIRAGDAAFDPKRDQMLRANVYERFTNCAQKAEDTYYQQQPLAASNGSGETPAKKPWYVMSESLKTRQMIAGRYKDKVVTDAETAYFHGDCGNHKTGGCGQEILKHAITHAVSQLQLFAMCNLHIIGDSGFPRAGTFLSQPPYRIYDAMGDCKYGSFKPWDTVMKLGAGFRI